jgi:hypothetical protein
LKLLQNRHVKVAMVVAPLLGVAAYMAMDYHLSEKPAAAVPGRSYPLAEASSCRYPSGYCTLENGDVKLKIRSKRIDETQVELTLSSALPLDSALVSAGTGGEFELPSSFSGAERRAVLALGQPAGSRLRWGFSIAGTTYYAETSAAFVDRQTIVSAEELAERSAE